MTDCPPDDTLLEYLNDSLTPDVVGPVTAHIDGCVGCQTRLDTLTSKSGELASRLKAADDRREFQPTLMAEAGSAPLVPPSARPSVLPVIPGYQVLAEIGRGGMGVVYKALHKRLNRPAAIKMVLAGGLADPRVTQRFLLEAEVLGRTRHPQVVQVYEVSMYAAPTGVSIPFLAMEFLDGGTLGDWSAGEPQPPKVAAALVEGLARAVQAAHLQGVIHRDLKPANILRAQDGTFKVTDFGLAKLTAETEGGLTGTGTVLGTPAYMAPEQASGEKGIGPTADVYSLGAILFELLAGRPPFDGAEPMSVLLRVIQEQPPDVRSIQSTVPRDLAAVVARCLTKEPHRRYPSAAELADDLARFCDGRPTRARAHGTAERLWYWSRRNPGIAAMLAALVLVMSAAFISVMVLWRRAEANAVAMGEAVDRIQQESLEAARQRDEAAKQRRAADRQGAYLAFDQATHWCEHGQLDDGLRGFVRALDLAERIGERELARVIRVNIAAWERELFVPGRLFRVADNAVLTASGFSPDGKWVFAAEMDTVRVWDADTGERVAVCTDASDGHVLSLIKGLPFTGGLVDLPSIRAVAISRDRTRIAAVASSGDIAVWDAKGGRPRRTFHPTVNGKKAGDLWATEFDRDGRLWVGGDLGLLARYDVETGRAVTELPIIGEDGLGKPSVQSLRVSVGGETLYTGDRAGRVLAWDLASGTPTTVGLIGGWVADVGLAESGAVTAGCGTRGAAVFGPSGSRWDLPTNGAYTRAIQFACGDRFVILGDADGRAQVWDAGSHAPVGGPLHLGLHSKSIASRPGRPEVLVSTADGVRLQPLAPPTSVVHPLTWQQARVRVLDFSPDGKRLLIGAGAMAVVEADTGRFVRRIAVPSEALRGRFLPDGEKVLLTFRSGWGVADPKVEGVPVIHPSTHYVTVVAADPSGRDVRLHLSGQFPPLRQDGTVGPVAAPLRGLDLRATAPNDALLAPGGRELRLALFDTVHSYDLTTGTPHRSPLRAADEIRALAQTRDGAQLATGLRDNSLQVWDVVTGEARYPLPPRHKFAVTDLAFSPDGRVLLSGSRDRTARFWDFETGLVLGPQLRHADAVMNVAFSPSGQRVATGTSAGRAAVWAPPPAPIIVPVEVLRARYAALRGNSFPVSAVYK